MYGHSCLPYYLQVLNCCHLSLLDLLIVTNSLMCMWLTLIKQPGCIQGMIRLEGGTNTSGRVEVCNDLIWGTVCDNGWDAADAQVACRQLGYSFAEAHILTRPDVPDVTGQIWLDQVNCDGTESRLFDCSANIDSNHNCSHDMDAGVTCG